MSLLAFRWCLHSVLSLSQTQCMSDENPFLNMTQESNPCPLGSRAVLRARRRLAWLSAAYHVSPPSEVIAISSLHFVRRIAQEAVILTLGKSFQFLPMGIANVCADSDQKTGSFTFSVHMPYKCCMESVKPQVVELIMFRSCKHSPWKPVLVAS